MSHIYDYLVIGGGSGGIASARRAASYGAKTLIIENNRWGGTCVNVGCVPKKIMYNAAMIRETLGDAKGYGFDVPSRQINWNMLKQKRDAYITRLNGIYERNLDNDKVERVYGLARFVGHNKVQVNDREYEAKHVLIATGSYDMRPTWPGAELSLSSEDFFDIEHLPRHVAVNGAGYIAIELAGIFQYLGCQVSLFIRQGTFLRTFDTMIQTKIMDEYRKAGMEIIPYSKIESLTRTASHPTESVVQNPNAYAHTVEYTNTQTGERKTLEGVNLFLAAIGRKPQTPKLNLSALSDLKYDAKEFIVTNAYQDTHVPNLHALGDVCGKYMLTPVAIAAGRRLADRLFGGKLDAKIDYENIATVVFSHPPSGTIGLTEDEAKARYGEANIKVWSSSFVNMYYSMCDHKGPTSYKIVCEGPNHRVVGLHLVGMGSDEILQGFAVAIRMGATKHDFDQTIAIHPTAAEELVTMK